MSHQLLRPIPRSTAGKFLAWFVIVSLGSTFVWSDPLQREAFLVSGAFGFAVGGVVYILVRAIEWIQ